MQRNIIVRLVIYYVMVIVLLGGLFSAFPVLGRYVAAERAREGARASLETDRPPTFQTTPAAAGPVEWLDPERSIPIVLSLVSALLVALPVAWVYRWTRPRRRYSQTFAQTLILVPIAITLVVFLVKGSLALAFSLAGIVAAVRFAEAFLDEHAKKWRMAEVAAEADGTSVIEFDLRLKKSVDLAAFVREIKQGTPHVTNVELTRSKSKKPADHLLDAPLKA